MARQLVFLAILVSVFLGTLAASRPVSPNRNPHPRVAKSVRDDHPIKFVEEMETDFWRAKAQKILADKLAQNLHTKRAKNVIMFLGDGMSVHTVTATRNLLGDSSQQVYFEEFPVTGLSKTYCVNRQVADSACTATAYLGGVKANYGTIGLNAKVPRYSCDSSSSLEANFVESIAKWAQDAGKDAGFVTTARVTHASPAGVYAHTANRNWENDGEVEDGGCKPDETIDIARQLVEWPVGKQLKVILGGGRKHFINSTVNDEEGIPGNRRDGRHLINDWLEDKKALNASAHYVWSLKGLTNVDLSRTDYLLGLFSSDHLPYNGDRIREYKTKADPSLSELTEAAVKVLHRNDEGYFLFVEGARIDMAHHDSYARRSLEDTAEFAEAVRMAREMTSEEDTLIVVTADHSHTMTINGYPYRDLDITGLAQAVGDDNKPWTILSYANGMGYYGAFNGEDRTHITNRMTQNMLYQSPSYVPLNAETHGGDDVAVYASGPYAQYFSGNYEQSNIPALMARAAEIGPYANA